MPRMSPEEKDVDVDVDIARLAGAVWRRKLAILLSTAAFAGIGFAAATVIPPRYKADTQLVVEARESSFTRRETGTGSSDGALSPESVESQVSLITSSEILGTVAEKFDLAARPEFAPPTSLVDRLLLLLRPERESTSGEVIDRIRQKLQVYRRENQRVLVIEFSSVDPTLARDVPDAIAAEYLARQKGALASSNSNATGWLEEEIADLREAVKAAEAKVADFRASSDLLIGQNQNVLATQQLSEIATELSRTRAARAAAEGRAQSVRDALDRGLSLDAVSDVLSSPTIQALRERQVGLKASIADLSTTLLDGHPRLRSLRSQLRDLDGQIASEAAKVQSSLETEADSARSREASLETEMQALKAASAKAGGEEVELRSLEREAASQSQLLESYLTRYREAASRGNRDYLPVDARVFSAAQIPSEAYFPKVGPITAAAGLAGFLLSAIVILMRELFSGRALRPAPMSRAARWSAPLAEGNAPAPRPAGIPETSVLDLADAIGASGTARVLCVGASAAGSVALARALAESGTAVVLVDLADGAAAAQLGARQDLATAADLFAGNAAFADVIHRDWRSEAHVVSGGATLGADDADELLQALRDAYDCVLVDCGALDRDRLQTLIDDDTAVVVAAPEGALATETLATLGEAGLADMVVMRLDADEERRSYAA